MSYSFYKNYSSKRVIRFQSFNVSLKFFICSADAKNQKKYDKLKVVISHCFVVSGCKPKESDYQLPNRNKRIALGCSSFAEYTKRRRDKR